MQKMILLLGFICLTFIGVKANTSKKLSDSTFTQNVFPIDTSIVPLVQLGARSANGLTMPVNLTGVTSVDLTALNLKAGELIAALPQQYQSNVKIFYFAMYPGANQLIKDADGHSLLFKEYESRVKLLSTYYILMGTMTDGSNLEFDIEMKLPNLPNNDVSWVDMNGNILSLRNNTNLRGNGDHAELNSTYKKKAKNAYEKAKNEANIGNIESEAFEALKKMITGGDIGPNFINPAGFPVNLVKPYNIRIAFSDVPSNGNDIFRVVKKTTITGFEENGKKYAAKIQNNKFYGYYENDEYNDINKYYEPSNTYVTNQDLPMTLFVLSDDVCAVDYYGAIHKYSEIKTKSQYLSGVPLNPDIIPNSKKQFIRNKGLYCGIAPTDIIYNIDDEYKNTELITALKQEFNTTKNAQKNDFTGENFSLKPRLYITLKLDPSSGLSGKLESTATDFEQREVLKDEILYWYMYDPKTKGLAAYGQKTVKDGALYYYSSKWELYLECAKIPFKVIHEIADGFSVSINAFKIPEKYWNCDNKEAYYKWHGIIGRKDINAKIKDYSNDEITKTWINEYLDLEAVVAFNAGKWNGLVDIVKGVSDLGSLGARAPQAILSFMQDPIEYAQSVSSTAQANWRKFNEPIYEMNDDGSPKIDPATQKQVILCSNDQSGFYGQKIGFIKSGLAKAIEKKYGGPANKCKRNEAIGSIVGPLFALSRGNIKALESSSLGFASKFVKFLALCDEIGDKGNPLPYIVKLFFNSKNGVALKVIDKLGKQVAEVTDDGKYMVHQLFDGKGEPLLNTGQSFEIDEPTMEKGLKNLEINVDNKKGFLVRKIFGGKIIGSFLGQFISTIDIKMPFLVNNNNLIYRLRNFDGFVKSEITVATKDANGDFDVLDNIDDTTTPSTDIEIVDALDDEMGVAKKKGSDACELRNPGGCFIAGTKVHTRTGIKKIEEVCENEEVLCFDEKKKSTTFARVALAFSLTAHYLTKVIVGKDTLTTTPNHPFFVPSEVSEADGSHWLQAGSLRKGALILLASGIMASVDTAYSYAATAPVYNFEIAEHHNYYVGKSGVLVHNGNCITAAIKNFLDSHPTAKNWPQAKKDKFLDDFKESPTFVSAFKSGDLDIDAWDVLHTAESAARLSHEALEKLTKLLKNNRFKWTKVEFEKMFTKLNKTIKKGTDVTEVIDGESLIAQAGNMLSEVELLNAIKNLDARYDIGNADALMKELCCESPWKFVGAEMVLRYIEKDGLWDKVKEFEKYVDKRYIDIVLNKGNKTVRVEVKSWIKIYKNTFLKQFAKDLDAVNNLDELLWIFDNKYPNVLKTDVIDVLKSPSGKATLGNINDFKNKVKKFFPNQASLVDDSNYIDIFLDNLDKKNVFDKVFLLR